MGTDVAGRPVAEADRRYIPEVGERVRVDMRHTQRDHLGTDHYFTF